MAVKEEEGDEKVGDEAHYKALAFGELDQSENISPGCAVVVTGRIVLSPPTATQVRVAAYK